jgi:hypothetical protein
MDIFFYIFQGTKGFIVKVKHGMYFVFMRNRTMQEIHTLT